jgi:hypothetical protein
MFAEVTSNFAYRLQRERDPSTDAGQAQAATEEVKPIKALPILLSVARDSVVGSIRRIVKGSDES